MRRSRRARSWRPIRLQTPYVDLIRLDSDGCDFAVSDVFPLEGETALSPPQLGGILSDGAPLRCPHPSPGSPLLLLVRAILTGRTGGGSSPLKASTKIRLIFNKYLASGCCGVSIKFGFFILFDGLHRDAFDENEPYSSLTQFFSFLNFKRFINQSLYYKMKYLNSSNS